MLTHVTFTGWDDHTGPGELREFLLRYPPRSIEVAVLLSQGRMGNDRYPEAYHAEAILRAAQEAHQRTAVHVCGPLSRAMLKLQRPPAGETSALVGLAERVQINVGEETWSTTGAKYEAAVGLAENVSPRSVIVQVRDEAVWPPAHPGVYYLFDRSAGRGEVIGECPAPPPDKLVGYAGGLGPGNVAEFLWSLDDTLSRGNPECFWIDMESGVRQPVDIYPGGPMVGADRPQPTRVSYEKCAAVMRAVEPWLRP